MAQVYLKIVRVLIVTVLFEWLCTTTIYAQPKVEFISTITGLSAPVDIVNAGDGSHRLFIVQRTGQVRVYSGGTLLPGSFIDLSSIITDDDSEQGLLSLAFAPDYATSGLFFVYYTRAADGAVTIARYQGTGNTNVALPNSGQVLLTVPKPAGRTNHNGGKLNFGNDGFLYFALGDGGGSGDPDNRAQNKTLLQGKMLRLDINRSTSPFYNIPSTNPYVGNSSGFREEIWSLGLRNPWRWSFDRLTHEMWIADVGQGAWEEVNVIPAGASGTNYGWRCYEGVNDFNTTGCMPLASYQSPIFQYPHNNATGGFAITGGYVYRGANFPKMYGYYITADYSSGNVWSIIPNGGSGWTVTIQDDLPGNISGFGEDEDGELYAVSLNAGIVYNVQANISLPVILSRFIATPDDGSVALSWKTDQEINLKQFEIEYSTDAINFQRAGTVKATNSPNGNTYHFDHVVMNANKVYYRLKMVDIDEAFEYSAVISVEVTGAAKNYIFPTIVTTGTVSVYLSEQFQSIEIINMVGKLLRKDDISGRTGRIDISLPVSATGTCLVKLVSRDPEKNIIRKIIIR